MALFRLIFWSGSFSKSYDTVDVAKRGVKKWHQKQSPEHFIREPIIDTTHKTNLRAWSNHELIFQWYVNCINLLVNLIFPTTILGILNFFVYQVLSRNSDNAKQLRRTTVVTEDKLRKRDVR